MNVNIPYDFFRLSHKNRLLPMRKFIICLIFISFKIGVCAQDEFLCPTIQRILEGCDKIVRDIDSSKFSKDSMVNKSFEKIRNTRIGICQTYLGYQSVSAELRKEFLEQIDGRTHTIDEIDTLLHSRNWGENYHIKKKLLKCGIDKKQLITLDDAFIVYNLEDGYCFSAFSKRGEYRRFFHEKKKGVRISRRMSCVFCIDKPIEYENFVISYVDVVYINDREHSFKYVVIYDKVNRHYYERIEDGF